MQTLVLEQEIEPLPEGIFKPFKFRNEGLLMSSYKQENGKNFFQSSPKSIFGIKQKIKSRQYRFTSGVDTILKLSVFTIILAIALF